MFSKTEYLKEQKYNKRLKTLTDKLFKGIISKEEYEKKVAELGKNIYG